MAVDDFCRHICQFLQLFITHPSQLLAVTLDALVRSGDTSEPIAGQSSCDEEFISRKQLWRSPGYFLVRGSMETVAKSPIIVPSSFRTISTVSPLIGIPTAMPTRMWPASCGIASFT